MRRNFWHRSMNFQSPLHRGRVFNVRSCSVITAVAQAFSPLFIGEGSSTQAYMFITGDRDPFSPLFIGEGSSTKN